MGTDTLIARFSPARQQRETRIALYASCIAHLSRGYLLLSMNL
jgi:hypothetical protein